MHVIFCGVMSQEEVYLIGDALSLIIPLYNC